MEHDQPPITVLAIAPQDAVIDRLRAFEIACGRKGGLRLVREDGVVAVSIDPSRIERLGPVVEAAAVIAGVRLLLRHPLGDVDVPLGGDLDNQPSGLWAAIGDAIDEDAVERSRGMPSGDLFRHVRVDLVQGVATAADARPPRVEPIGGPADDFGSQKFDDVDYHQAAAEAAGQPIEQAFTHMGLFLAWSIRHNLHDPRFFPPDHVDRIKARTWTGSDISDDVDGKLVSDMFTAEGAEFASAQYGDYLEAYGNTFPDMADYGVTDDASSASRIEPILDVLYRAWIAAGKPPPEPSAVSDLEATEFAQIPDIPWEEIPAGHSVAVTSDGSWGLVEQTRPHEAPEVEKLVPADLLDEALELMSSSASHWGSSLLNRALRDLNIRPKDASVATALGGSGERTLAISIYRVPGIDADRLSERFASDIVRPGRARWQDRVVDGRRVSWAEGEWAPGEGSVAVAYWTRDGYVFHAAGQPEDVALAVRRVGESLDA